MTPERWRQIERLYHEARELRPEDRAAFLREAGGEDDGVRRIVESLLAGRDEAPEFLEPGAAFDATHDRPSELASDGRLVDPGAPRRRPWWVWSCTLATLAVAGSLCWVILASARPLWIATPLVGRSALYLVLAAVLLFSRPHDRAARWGAVVVVQLSLAGLYSAIGPLGPLSPDVGRAIRSLPWPVGVLALLGIWFSGVSPAGAFGFATVFPRPLPRSRHLSWLFLLAPAITLSPALHWLWLPVYGSARAQTEAPLDVLAALLGGMFFIAAVALLSHNYRRLAKPSERRRVRIVALGFGLTFLVLAVGMFNATPWAPFKEGGVAYALRSQWKVVKIFLHSAAPICMTYAILRHRVFDIQVIIRLGVRYAAARGVLLSIVPLTAVILALDVAVHRRQRVGEILAQRGLLYVALGAAAFVLHVKRKAWMDALDRRFFRERYDAHRILAAVAGDVRHSPSFDEGARRVIVRIDEALHPESVSVMIRQPHVAAYHTAAGVNDTLPFIPADARVIALARALGKPLEIPQSGTGWIQEQLPAADVKLLRRARVEWLFPVLFGGAGPEAFLLLGPKRSEEPYSGEDRMMLQAVTAGLGLLLERLTASSPSSGFAECPDCGTCYDAGTVRCEIDDSALMKSPYARTVDGRYRLARRLGRGGMGRVYEAADTLLGRRVAVKVIREDWITSAEAVARFRREARAVASLTHPHVVTVHDFGVDTDGRAYMVMEMLEGCTLREELRVRGSIEPKRTLEILKGVASAVARAHECRLLHRDLKPENIFLARSDHGEVAKVLDFGLVKQLGPTSTERLTGTAAGALIGTSAYMSPEQRAGEDASETWDTWALTVIAFEMVAGVHPFGASGEPWGPPAGGRRVAVRSSDVAPGPAVARYFERALATDRAGRPASVRDFIEGLEAALQLTC